MHLSLLPLCEVPVYAITTVTMSITFEMVIELVSSILLD